MRVTAEDIVALTGFPLLWRWTQETHAKFKPEELASIQPILSSVVTTICDASESTAVVPSPAEDHIVVEDDTDALAVRKWLDERVPRGEGKVFLVWDRETAALVPRQLFVDRWSDFWYPSSDDLTVMGNVGDWRVEMYHHGMFTFSARGAVEQGVGHLTTEEMRNGIDRH